MKLTPLEGNSQHFVTCGSSDITPATATSNARTGMTIKWQFNHKRVMCAKVPFHKVYGTVQSVFGGRSLKILHVRIQIRFLG